MAVANDVMDRFDKDTLVSNDEVDSLTWFLNSDLNVSMLAQLILK